MSFLVSALLNDAAAELNVQAGLTPADQNLMLIRLNQILDNWNVDRTAVWCDIFTEFTFTPNLSPHTIGPSGATWTMAIRPEKLTACALNINTSSPNLYIPITVIGREQYESIAQPGIAAGIPYAVYYERDFPNGKLYFYVVPSIAYKARLTTSTLLSAATLSTDMAITFPPGYQNALMLTLAEDCATPFGRQVMPMTTEKARAARARIFNANIEVPVLITKPAGLEVERHHKTSFNYISRSFT